MITTYMQDKIRVFASKYPKRIIKVHTRYLLLQGKMNTIRLYYSGVVKIGNNGCKGNFKFSEEKIKKLM
jgi:hypothetical protein